MNKLFILIATLFSCFSLSAVAQNVGIGVTNPSAKLEVNGNVKIDGGSPAPGRVLTTVDGTGLATWQDPASTPHVAFRAYLSSDQAISSFTDTKINFAINFGFNDGNSYNDGTNSFISPAAGLYYFHASFTMSQPTSVNPTVMRIYSNGSLLVQSSNAIFQSTGSYYSTIDVSCITKLVAGDVVNVSALTSGAATVNNYSGSTFFEGYRIY